MRIMHVAGSGIQGQTFKHDLDRQVVVFVGRNGSGKTTRLKAVELALRGPGKQDKRLGDAATAHVRLREVPIVVAPGGQIEVLRGLTPKHTLALPPLAASGSASLATMTGKLDAVISLVPAVFDLAAFTALSAAKQKDALLPFATFIPATEYAHLYEPVQPFEGEAGSDFLARVRLAIQTEINVLQAKKVAAEKASVTMAGQSVHNGRTREQVTAEMQALDAKLLELRAALDGRTAVATCTATVAACEQGVAQCKAQLEAMPGGAPSMGPSADELRVTVNALQADRAKVEAVRTAADNAARVRGEVQTHEQALAGMGGAQSVGDIAGLERQVQQLLGNAQEARRLDGEITRAQGAVGQVFVGQMEALALILKVRAALLRSARNPGDAFADATTSVLDLEQTLLARGFPAAGAAAEQLQQLQATRANIALPTEQDLQAAQTQLAGWRQANASVQARLGVEQTLAGARQRLASAETALQQARATLPANCPDAPALEQLLRDAQAALNAAVAQDVDRANASKQRAQAETELANAQARLVTATEALETQQRAYILNAGKIGLIGDLLDAPHAQAVAARPALAVELEAAIREEGKVTAERAMHADQEQAKTQLEAAKLVAERVKDAADDCLRKSLGKVGEVFAPFLALIDATWKLGDDDPLGCERAGKFIPYELLSDSEQLVFGIGLVLALSTLGQGLRLVLLDNLDACDLQRRQAIVAIAGNLIAQGKLDNVIGTAWSPEGFDESLVQVIRVGA